MAVPFRRTSKTKKRMRRTHLKKTAAPIVICPNCGAALQPHRACTKCGYYKGKDVLNVEKQGTVEEKTTVKPKKEKKKVEKKSTAKKTTKKEETKEEK